MAGDIGGFGEFIYVTLFLLIGGYANRMFYAEIIRDMFQVRLDTTLRRSVSSIMESGKLKDEKKLKQIKAIKLKKTWETESH